jgi:hypothetical protein
MCIFLHVTTGGYTTMILSFQSYACTSVRLRHCKALRDGEHGVGFYQHYCTGKLLTTRAWPTQRCEFVPSVEEEKVISLIFCYHYLSQQCLAIPTIRSFVTILPRGAFLPQDTADHLLIKTWYQSRGASGT